MVKHLFKLIWNKKKKNFLLMLEILISFMVMFAVFTLVVYFYQNYKRPMGFEYENVWSVKFGSEASGSSNQGRSAGNSDSILKSYETIRQTLKSQPQVKELSFVSNNIPFTTNTNDDQIQYGNAGVTSDIYSVEDGYLRLFNLNIEEGRWFSKEDNASRVAPVVINHTLKENLFGNEDAIGKIITRDNGKTQLKVVGVANDMKNKGDYQGFENSLFTRIDSSSLKWVQVMLLKVSPDVDASFESHLFKMLTTTIRNANIQIEHLSVRRVASNRETLIPVIVLLIVAAFLIINVALGVFGVLWFNISKRKGEIGLRRAIGASGNSISRQLIGEALVLSTISLIAGSFFAIQFPLLNVFDLPSNTYFISITFSILSIYLLVIICSLYPGRQAAAIYPAIALHEE